MNTFNYEALSRAGTYVSGEIEAFSETDAVEKIKADYAVVMKVARTSKKLDIDLALGGSQFTDKILSLVCKQFAIILGAGLPIVRTVQLVAEQTASKTMKRVLFESADDIAAGRSLAESFKVHGKDLPATFIESIRAGEESGNLEEVFTSLSSYYDKSAKVKSKAASAMIYPAFVIAVAVVVIGIIMIYAVPVFSTTFQSMGVELPWVTRAMISMSEFLTKYILVLVGLVAALIIVYKLYKKTEKGKIAFARLSLKLPLFGKVALMRGVSQYANTMAIMLSAGLSVIRSVEITGKSMKNYMLGKALSSTIPYLEAGERLGLSVKKAAIFPDLIIEMTLVGEETGALESTLLTVAEYYDNEVSLATERLLSILEPVIICILAAFVVLVLFSVYIPLFSMYGSVA